MFSWLWRFSSPQVWPSRPTAVGANAPSANRANAAAATAAAKSELARWGVYPSGYTPLFLNTVTSRPRIELVYSDPYRGYESTYPDQCQVY